MEINVKVNINLDDLSVERINQIGLINSTQLIRKNAQENAPVMNHVLKKSIGVEPNSINRNTTEARI